MRLLAAGTAVICLAFGTATVVAVPSPQTPPGGVDGKRVIIETSLAMMRGNGWQERASGFYHLFSAEGSAGLHGETSRIPTLLGALLQDVPEQADSVRTGLIQLLGFENAYRRTSSGRLPEEYGSYFGDVIAAVATLDDRRAAPALLENLDRGRLAMQGVARLGGDATLDQLIGLTSDESELKRNAALRTLALMLDPSINRSPVTPAARAKINGAFVRGVKDDNGFVRISAVEGLGRMSGGEATELLEAVAKSDPFRQVSESGAVSYPVRDGARKALIGRRQDKKDVPFGRSLCDTASNIEVSGSAGCAPPYSVRTTASSPRRA